MTHITLCYNPFEPSLKIIRDGEKLSPYSSLNRMFASPLSSWITRIFPELYQEVNTRYEAQCVSMPFAGELLREAAMKEGHCVRFHALLPPMREEVCERLRQLAALAPLEPQAVRIPVYNASAEPAMSKSVQEILEESGLFSKLDSRTLQLRRCPADVRLAFARKEERRLFHADFSLLLCASADDVLPWDDGPSFALVMGRKTEILSVNGNQTVLSADSDRLADAVQNLLEDELLCPLLRKNRDRLLNSSPLPEGLKETLTLLCKIAPACVADFPARVDAGRREELRVSVFPGGTELPLHVRSSNPHALTAEGLSLKGVGKGRSTVSVFLGDDPYPAASGEVSVTERRLIQRITLFPSTLYLPVGERRTLSLSFLPEDAENAGEILWRSSNPAVAQVDSTGGQITAGATGRCVISASTREADAQCALIVQPLMEDISVPGYYVEIERGTMTPWKYQASPADAYGAEFIAAQSSNPDIAQYAGGYIRAGKPGECKIFIHTRDRRIVKEIRVKVRKKGLFR